MVEAPRPAGRAPPVTARGPIADKRGPIVGARSTMNAVSSPQPPDIQDPRGTPGTGAAGPARGDSMRGAVSSGAAWMISGTLLTKGATFLAQVVCGKILSDEDFGLVALAVAASKILTICQDGGVRDLLVQSKPDQYDRLAGRVFWFAFAFNMSVALLIAGAAYPLSVWFYHQPELIPMFLVLALAVPFGTPGAVLQARLRLDLRFRAVSGLGMTSALLRQASTICFAMLGLGAMSFIIPALVCAAVESLLAWWLTRDSIWKRPADRHTWMDLYRQTKWLIFGSVANLLIDRGPYLVMQPVLIAGGTAVRLATATTGNYFWAYEMTGQIGVLLSYNMQLVLTPVLARLKDDVVRMGRSTLKTMSGLMMVGSLASLGLAVVMDPLEKLVFNGKWAAATPAVAVFGIFFPFRILYGLSTAVMVARGHTKAWCITSFIEGLAFTLAAAVAATIASGHLLGSYVEVSAGSMAWITGATLATARVLITVWTLRGLHATVRESLVEMFWPWILAMLAAGSAWLLDQNLQLDSTVTRVWDADFKNLTLAVIPGAGAAESLRAAVAGFGLGDKGTARLIELVRFFLTGSTCTLVFTFLARLFMGDVLREGLRVLPGPARKLGYRVLLLRENPA